MAMKIVTLAIVSIAALTACLPPGNEVGENTATTLTIEKMYFDPDGLAYALDSELPFTGSYQPKYPDDEYRSAITYKDGLRNGRAIEFYPSGEVKSVSRYENGTIINDEYRYSANGIHYQTVNHDTGDITIPTSFEDHLYEQVLISLGYLSAKTIALKMPSRTLESTIGSGQFYDYAAIVGAQSLYEFSEGGLSSIDYAKTTALADAIFESRFPDGEESANIKDIDGSLIRSTWDTNEVETSVNSFFYIVLDKVASPEAIGVDEANSFTKGVASFISAFDSKQVSMVTFNGTQDEHGKFSLVNDAKIRDGYTQAIEQYLLSYRRSEIDDAVNDLLGRLNTAETTKGMLTLMADLCIDCEGIEEEIASAEDSEIMSEEATEAKEYLSKWLNIIAINPLYPGYNYGVMSYYIDSEDVDNSYAYLVDGKLSIIQDIYSYASNRFEENTADKQE